MPVASTSPDPSTTLVWRSIRRWNLATALIGLIAWVVAAIVLVLGGEMPSPPTRLSTPTQNGRTCGRRASPEGGFRGRPRENADGPPAKFPREVEGARSIDQGCYVAQRR
jgi:hypothetical protein